MMYELTLHIIDIVQNSIRAESRNIKINIFDSLENDKIIIEIIDDGKGMDEETKKKVENPFYTTKQDKSVGLGVPLLKQTALHCDGKFFIESQLGRGTKIHSEFKKYHIDLPPLGNLSDTFLTLLTYDEKKVNIIINYTNDKGEFKISTNEIKEEIKDIPITSPEVISFLKSYINENLNKLKITGQ